MGSQGSSNLFGWSKRVLWVDLSRGEFREWRYPGEMARMFIGGRGFAAKILWDFLEPGADPLGPRNLFIAAVGPLTGLPGPNTGKLVVAAKSPLTGGYGDGNIGSWAAVQMRAAGWDAIVVEGVSEKPVVLVVEDDRAWLEPAEDLWGLDAFRAYDRLVERYGRDAGILLIGPAGENLVRYATVVSMKGRAGGRPGIGAVMGSKRLKAIVVRGSGKPELFDPDAVMKYAVEAIREIKTSPNYGFWMRQGTMFTIEWAQEASVLPAYNFREAVFEGYEGISGSYMERIEVDLRSCPLCVMACGHVIDDSEGRRVELDYENVAMLGSNLGISRLEEVGLLNRLADVYGLDTISLGGTLGYALEAAERGKLELDAGWGETKKIARLIEDITFRRGVGDLLAEGVARLSQRVGETWYAMHVKGLEVSAYDCRAAPGMALAYATSPIGAHHKDAWMIGWEVQHGRTEYNREKVRKLIWMQRFRGGLFETAVACRFPVVETGLGLEHYVRLFQAATGLSYSLDDIFTVADRVYALIRMIWVREHGGWSIEKDMPPERWFRDPLTKGPLKGAKLDRDRFIDMLRMYYEERGWAPNGVPRPDTLRSLGLDGAAELAEKYTIPR
ncbi:Tungsten-containing formaldehyde:ferredoxin oxidoreductase [Pyrodictium delaneyi]|uniref:Tungsten-containing formaldehyde:ferredoxin oxidoreductase n=1 Tax=Pyrodictium delaneyi TaxID=1273541 RepID=A0A0P0N1V3_9CREN|nr:aldehyde ferredoxin oxidoreductase family protein [Pyrodictium delaneyi]ALL00376.1 Tungsten-containing formaldehyde:ferredoxin oxidoreductase [Pyrodictium delaneyi]